jgi:hypothetical protein
MSEGLNDLTKAFARSRWTPRRAPDILAAATDSLRDIHSIRDFVAAVEVGSRVASGMLDDIEAKLIHILRKVNEDAS